MFRSSRVLLSVVAAMAFASVSFAASPPVTQADPPGARAELVKVAKADVNPISLKMPSGDAIGLKASDPRPMHLSATGAGAASAYQAWVKSLQASAEPRTIREFQRMHPGLKPEDKLTPLQREQLLRIVHRLRDPCLNVRGPGEHEGDEPDSSIRRLT